ncbi:unnamed protein product [Schistosoma margrebowiei]|uniref:Uncharacterized protein n=1 Tax=Schistosoma margrebowiei TaxID=48269 RepID=A0A183MVM9_9TREM|nr:unnamed protein product [Schistosoma margrebowiei]
MVLFSSVDVDGSNHILDGSHNNNDKFNFENDGNFDPSDSQLGRHKHNRNPPNFIAEYLLEIRCRNGGRYGYPAICYPGTGQYYL